ncbi:MAG: hypothetical protein AABZ14_06715 [Candidatus Margulisiibacteriota bacterium]
MAWRVLIIFSFLMGLGFGWDYEVIKNTDQQGEMVTIYLGSKEVLSLKGNDTEALRKAYTFIARLMQCHELHYDPEQLVLRQVRASEYGIYWADQKLVSVTEQERSLNGIRGNTLLKMKDLVKGGRERRETIAMPVKGSVFKGINQIKEIAISFKENVKVFPAVHAFLPIGTKVRVINPLKDWSVVVEIVRNEDVGLGNVLGIPRKAIQALGVNAQASSPIRTQFL